MKKTVEHESRSRATALLVQFDTTRRTSSSAKSFFSHFILHPSSLILTLILLGCSGYTGPRSVVNEDPYVKIPEIHKAVDRGDTSVLPQLVSDLDSDDPAVRLYSIGALERLTGQTFGYDWTQEDRAPRRPAIDQWNAYLASAATQPTSKESTGKGPSGKGK